MRRWWWIPTLVVVVSACGTGASDSDSFDASDGGHATVSSDNGLAILSLVAGSLPEGTTLDEIQLDAVASADAIAGIPTVRVQLLPHGLTLSQAAVLSIRLPNSSADGFMVIHQSGAYVEFLDGHAQIDAEGLYFTTAIEHFSYVDIIDLNVQHSMALAPNPVSPGQVQKAVITATVDDTVSVLIGWGDGEALEYRFAVEPLATNETGVHWETAKGAEEDDGFDGEFWNPPRVEGAATVKSSGWEFTASSTCVQPNVTRVVGETFLRVRLTLKSINPNVALLRLAEMLVGLEPSGVVAIPDFEADVSEESLVELDQLSVGDTVESAIHGLPAAESTCTEISTASTSTGSALPPVDDEVVAVPAGMDPRAVIVGVEPVVTANGTRGFVVTFAQGLVGIPELYSYFFLLDFSDGVCSESGGVESHANAKTQLGSANTSLLDTGQVLVDTGCSLDSKPFDVVGKSGSQDTSTEQARFLDFIAHVAGSDLDGALGVEGETVCDFADQDALASGCSQ